MPYIELEYNIKKDTVECDSDLRSEMIPDTISTFLQTQIGAGVDKSKAEERKIYYIRISIDLSDDTFNVKSNTGNKGLRDGILMRAVQLLSKEDSDD
jgi:hypothetical protein